MQRLLHLIQDPPEVRLHPQLILSFKSLAQIPQAVKSGSILDFLISRIVIIHEAGLQQLRLDFIRQVEVLVFENTELHDVFLGAIEHDATVVVRLFVLLHLVPLRLRVALEFVDSHGLGQSPDPLALFTDHVSSADFACWSGFVGVEAKSLVKMLLTFEVLSFELVIPTSERQIHIVHVLLLREWDFEVENTAAHFLVEQI